MADALFIEQQIAFYEKLVESRKLQILRATELLALAEQGLAKWKEIAQQ